MVRQGFQAQRWFLLITTKAQKPDMPVFQRLLKPINDCMITIASIKEANRGSPVFNNLSAVSEGILLLAWVTIDSRPWKHVEESAGSAQFFGNRVLKEYRDKYDGPFRGANCPSRIADPIQGSSADRMDTVLLPDFPGLDRVHQAALS